MLAYGEWVEENVLAPVPVHPIAMHRILGTQNHPSLDNYFSGNSLYRYNGLKNDLISTRHAFYHGKLLDL